MRKIIKWASASPYELLVEITGLIFTGLILATTYSIFEYPVSQIALFGLIGALCALPFFILCHFSKSHHRLGTVLCLVVYIGGLFLTFRLSMFGYFETGEGFMQWLVQDNENVGFSVYYAVLLLVGGAGLFGTAVYYFTVIRYRMGMLVAISLLPCVLYAKAIADVNNWYLVLLAGINLAECILQRRYRREIELNAEDNGMASEDSKGTIAPFIEKEGSRTDYLMRFFMVFGFIALVLVVAAVVPKQSEARYYDLFEDTFLGGDINSEVTSVSGELTEMSGNADGFRSVSNRRIYEIYGDGEISYFKRQTFDIYDFSKDRWTALEDDVTPTYTEDEWDVLTSDLNLTDLQSAFKYAEEVSPGFAEKYGLENIVSADAVEYTANNLTIKSLNFPASYYITPPGTVSVSTGDISTASVTWAGNFVRNDGKHDGNYSYNVSYSGDRNSMMAWCRLGGANMTDDECYSMFREMIDIYQQQMDNLAEDGKIKESYALSTCNEYRAVTAYADQYAEGIAYKNAVSENTAEISEEVKELAEEVTEGCTYDWEKALALQNYFRSGDFVYDIDYYAPDDSVEYFLFESRRGTCSDYATAFVLMARSLGMTVRYDEGYIAKSQGQQDVYYVRESNSHAFPEVYIQGTGWVIFEPTSGIVEDSGKNWWGKLIDSISVDYDLIRTIMIITVVIIVLVMIIRLIIPAVIEAVFELRLLRGRKNAADAYVRLLRKASSRKLRKKYRKMTGRIRFCAESKPLSLAPKKVKEIFAEMNCDISVIIDEVEKAAYRTVENPAAVADSNSAANANSVANVNSNADSDSNADVNANAKFDLNTEAATKKQIRKLRKMIVRAYRRGKKNFTL